MPPDPAYRHHDIEAAELSDTDVELLHQIVLRAQQSPVVQQRPRKALLEAYENVFAESGRDTRRDRACLRTILQLGDPRVRGDSLYEKFEHVLRTVGVNLAFRDDESVDPVFEEDDTQALGEDGSSGAGRLGQSPRRRASFTSMLDFTTEKTRPSKPRALSRGSDSQLPSRRPSPPPNRHISPQASDKKYSKSGRNGMTSANGPRPQPPNLKTREIRAQQSRRPKVPFSVYEDELSPIQSERSENFYGSREIDLEGDADAFNEMRIRNGQKAILQQWLQHARVNFERIRSQEIRAELLDYSTLKRQTLDLWRSAYHERNRQRQEVHMFGRLYHRAGRAYDLFLLTKAFTHWVQVAAVSVAQKNADRKRFLFAKYFNAWYQLTVSNELKAERQALKSPFNALRKRAAHYYSDEVKAVEVYHKNLTKLIFWRWFRELCDRGAPRIREQLLFKFTFQKWRRITNEICAREAKVGAETTRRALQHSFISWGTKARVDIAGYRQADAFRHSSLVKPALVSWKAENTLKPLERQLTYARNFRIARSAFNIWQLRARMAFRADAVNRLRMMQNCHSAWNERLRTQAVISRMDQRIVAEGLYRLVIAQRCALMERIQELNMKRRVWREFIAGLRQREEEFKSREEQFTIARKEYLLESTWNDWRQRASALEEGQQIALNFYQQQRKQNALEVIKQKLKEKAEAEKWATDARFYFLMTSSIKTWKKAAKDKKNERERAAHAKMRRKCKVNLARRLLYQWHDQAKSWQTASETSVDIYDKKMLLLRETSFRDWLAVTHQRQNDMMQGSNKHDQRVLGRCLDSIADTSRYLKTTQSQADQFRWLKTSEICASQIRKISMKAFEMKRREQDADAMRERHLNKHIRNILRHWNGKTKDELERELVGNGGMERSQETEATDAGYATASNEDFVQPSTDNDHGATHRAEEWTAFDTDLVENSEWVPSFDDEPVSTSTPGPAPGYLNTPSRRAVRAKALANISTTPVTTPMRMPFAARLRAGMTGTPSQIPTARRGGFGFSSTLRFNPQVDEGDEE